MKQKLCGCGDPAKYGNYCERCLDNEMMSQDNEDIEAAIELYDRLALDDSNLSTN